VKSHDGGRTAFGAHNKGLCAPLPPATKEADGVARIQLEMLGTEKFTLENFASEIRAKFV